MPIGGSEIRHGAAGKSTRQLAMLCSAIGALTPRPGCVPEPVRWRSACCGF